MAQSTQTPPVSPATNPTQGPLPANPASSPENQVHERQERERQDREEREKTQREGHARDQDEHLAQHRKERDEAIERIKKSDEDRDAMAERARASESDAERQERANRDMRTIRDMAEAATGHLPRAGEPAMASLSADAIRKEGEGLVKMTFDKPIMLTLPDYRTIRFSAGIQEVPESLVDDPYLKANGVTRV